MRIGLTKCLQNLNNLNVVVVRCRFYAVLISLVVLLCSGMYKREFSSSVASGIVFLLEFLSVISLLSFWKRLLMEYRFWSLWASAQFLNLLVASPQLFPSQFRVGSIVKRKACLFLLNKLYNPNINLYYSENERKQNKINKKSQHLRLDLDRWI